MQGFVRSTLLSVFALLALVTVVCHAAETTTTAIKDATILQTGQTICTNSRCDMCPRGQEAKLTMNLGLKTYIRALVGFHLPVPASQVTSCTVDFPDFITPLRSETELEIATAASSTWDEGTVTGANAPESGSAIAQVKVAPGGRITGVDVTAACRAADANGLFSIYVRGSWEFVELPSKEAGKPATLHVVSS
ncbi:hypothetical protein BGZ52_008153 [Haplosporangium bisporale]|nr:hypothetical protein BGZ52_008153 [Haplosporangium bisporale]